MSFRGHLLVEFSWTFLVNFHRRFLVVITNGANTVGQPTQGVRGGEAPAMFSEHC